MIKARIISFLNTVSGVKVSGLPWQEGLGLKDWLSVQMTVQPEASGTASLSPVRLVHCQSSWWMSNLVACPSESLSRNLSGCVLTLCTAAPVLKLATEYVQSLKLFPYGSILGGT